MMFKIVWYIFSLLIVFLILLNSPNSNSLNIISSQNRVFNFQSNKLLIQKIIGISVFIFLLLTIMLLV